MSTPAVTPQQQFQYIKLPDGTYGKFRADQSDAEIHSILSRQFPKEMGQVENVAGQPSDASASAEPAAFTLPWAKQQAYRGVKALADFAPAGGATVGAMIGGTAGSAEPGAGTVAGGVGGAGIGAMGGEAGRQLLYRAFLPAYGVGQGQAGDINEITKQGVIQGGVQALSEALPFLAPYLRKAAVGQYGKALAATTQENKAIAQDIAPQMMDRGITGSTQSIENQASQNINKLRPQLESAYAAVPKSSLAPKSPISTTLNALDAMKSKYIVDGQVVNPQAVGAIEATQQVIEKYGNNISPQSLRRIKQIFDESVSEAGGYTTNDLTTNYTLKAQREASNTIRNILHQANPDVAALDKEMSFWLDVQQVARATNLRRTGQEGGLIKTFMPFLSAGGGAAGFAHSPEAGAAGAITPLLVMATRSPAWRTTSAVVKDRIADAAASGSVGQLTAILTRAGLTTQRANSQSQPTSLGTPTQPSQP